MDMRADLKLIPLTLMYFAWNNTSIINTYVGPAPTAWLFLLQHTTGYFHIPK